MELVDGEPAVDSWRVEPLSTLVRMLLQASPAPPGRAAIVAIDGRSGAGKSALAARLQAAVPGSVVIHTDDVAWGHSFFGWADLMRHGVLELVRRGQPVRYRPPAWEQRGRMGSIEIPEGPAMVIVEGVGAARRELTDLIDVTVWVQSDYNEAKQRAIARDAILRKGDNHGASQFWHEWAAAELPFMAADRPWERACVMVSGTPDRSHDHASEVVMANTHADASPCPHG